MNMINIVEIMNKVKDQKYHKYLKNSNIINLSINNYKKDQHKYFIKIKKDKIGKIDIYLIMYIILNVVY